MHLVGRRSRIEQEIVCMHAKSLTVVDSAQPYRVAAAESLLAGNFWGNGKVVWRSETETGCEMLSCHAYFRAYLRAVVSDARSSSSSLRFAGAALSRRRALQVHIKPQQRWATSATVVARASEATTDVETDKNVMPQKTMYPRAALETELRYLNDPLKLAKNTLELLRRNDHVKALELVRLASRKMPCIVSWNHIIDYDMSKGKVAAAVKTYNEVGIALMPCIYLVLTALQMKKRAQPPDAYTYTLLLRGLADHTNYPQSLPRALTIYNSMYAENSPVRPSIIHTNAVLKVCARAGDIDAIFEIAAKLPSKGKGAPNNRTFTTVINALRIAAWRESEDLKHMNSDKRMEPIYRAVIQGRRMWEDIIGRWRNGEMLIDEEMVCAIGRLLLLGNTAEDCDDVLSLVEQTMGIERRIPLLGDPARKTHLTAPRAVIPELKNSIIDELVEIEKEGISTSFAYQDSVTDSPADTSHQNEQTTSSTQTTSQTPSHPPSPKEFSPIPLTPSSPPRQLARPSNSTLSLLIDTTIRIHAPAVAQSYWALLTSPSTYNVTPDAENLHMYLRLLRLARASRLAAALVADMNRPVTSNGLGITPQAKTFRIAMSACVRDAKNRAVVTHARSLLSCMLGVLEEPDLRTCNMYMSVLEKTIELSNGQEWQSVLQGLKELQIVVNNLKSILAYGSWRPKDSGGVMIDDIVDEEVEEAMDDSRAEAVDSVSRPPSGSASSEHHRDQHHGSAKANSSRARLPVRQLIQRMASLYGRVKLTAGEALGHKEQMDLNERRAALYAWVSRELTRRSEWFGKVSPTGRGPKLVGKGWSGQGMAKRGLQRAAEARASVQAKTRNGDMADGTPAEDMTFQKSPASELNNLGDRRSAKRLETLQ